MSSLGNLDLCRLCLVKDRVSVPIFEGEGDVRQIFLKITACLPVKVNREDKLPKKICDDCVYKVELCYQFWHTTANAEKQLLQWLGEVNMEDKQGYNVLNPNGMKEQNNENRLDGTVMQQVSEHQNNMNMGMMDNMGLSMPIMISSNAQQQITSVPMDNSGSSVQNVQPVAGPSTQTTHDQITQNQTDTPTQQEEEEESSEEEENSDDECDGDEGLPIKEESEEDPNNSRTIEPTTFVNVSLACDEAGPSGLQQQKIADMPEMVMSQTADVDPKTGQRRGGRLRAMHQCVKCGARFRHTRKLVEHLKNLHNIDRAFSCDECNKTFRSPMNIARHKLIHTGLKAFTCDLCEYSTNQKSNLECHRRRHAKDYSFKCETCGRGFFHKAEYLDHQNAHTNKRLYRCEHCCKNYLYKKNLSVHLVTHHAGKHAAAVTRSARTRHACKFCPERFVYKRLLERHMKNQHGFADAPAKHLCDLCGAELSSMRRLLVHKRNHAGERIFECDTCDKKFASKENLSIHKRTHTGDKPHVCQQCGRGFTQRTSLVLHLRYHSDQRPYQCLDCGKGFVSNTLLKRHRKVHEKIVQPKL